MNQDAKNLKFRWCESNEDKKLAMQASKISDVKFMEDDRFRAAVGNSNENTVASVWVAEDSFLEDELGLKLIFDDASRWAFSAMVSKPLRGKGVFPLLFDFCCDELAQMGVGEILAAVNPINRSSIQTFQKSTSTKIASVFAVRILGISYCIQFGRGRVSRRFSSMCVYDLTSGK